MTQKNLSIVEFADLLMLEAQRGIIDPEVLMQLVQENKLPKTVLDTRGAVRLTVERAGDNFDVTEHTTDLSQERINEVY